MKETPVPDLNALRDLFRKTFLPQIYDFSKDYPEYTDSKEPLALPSYIFIFMHPMGTKLTLVGAYWLTITILGTISAISFFKDNYVTFLIFLLILLMVIAKGWKLLKYMKIKGTIYNMFLKED